MELQTLLGMTLVTLSFSTFAKLPDPLWTPMGGNYQQQFGAPLHHGLSQNHRNHSNASKHDSEHAPASTNNTTAHTGALPIGGA